MLEVYASTIAWISVVVVQALVHYFVFGARRERIDEVLLEESLSLSTSVGSIDSEFDIINTPNTPTGDPSFSSISYVSLDRHDGNLTSKFEIVPSTSTRHEASINLNETDVARKVPFYLMQTGTEVLKVC
jgi:hypothetical protein